MNFIETIARQAGRYPDKLALTSSSINSIYLKNITFKGLLQELAFYSNEYKLPGNQSPGTIILLISNKPDSIIAIIAFIFLGYQVIPLSSTIDTAFLEEIIGLLKPDMIWGGKTDLESFVDVLSSKRICVVTKMSSTKKNLLSRKTIRQEKSSQKGRLILCSSGSTGKPKIIVYSFIRLNRFMAKLSLVYRQFPDRSNDQSSSSPLIAALPVYHFGGLVFVLQGLITGRTVHFMNQFSPKLLMRLLSSIHPTLLFLTPGMYINLSDIEDVCLPASIKYCFYGGEPFNYSARKRVERKLKNCLLAAYGLSECLTGVSQTYDSIIQKGVPDGSCGKHLFGNIMLLNKGEVPRGLKLKNNIKTGKPTQGILWVKNTTVAKPYLNDDLNAQATFDNWFCTGDILRQDENGYFYYVKRNDEVFQVNGKNFYPSEIEGIYSKHRLIKASIVATIMNNKKKRIIALLYVLKSELKNINTQEMMSEKLMAFYLNNKGSSGMPLWYWGVNVVPYNKNGKLDRKASQQILQKTYNHYVGSR